MITFVLFALHRGIALFIDSFAQISKTTKQHISIHLFIFVGLWVFPCMGMERSPVEIDARQECVLAIPVIDAIALQDLQIKDAFNTIENASLDQLEEFVYQEINKLMPHLDQMIIMKYQLEPFLYAQGQSLREMIHTLLHALSEAYTDVLQEKDAKERMIMIQSIFFYVLYYMRSTDGISRGNIRHDTVRELMRTSFELAITMITDCNYAIMPFSKKGIDDETYTHMRDTFKQMHPNKYVFLKTVARNKIQLSLLLMNCNVPLTIPLSTMISIAQEFEQFVTPRG